METKIGKASSPILTEEAYCPRHALTYEEAYKHCDTVYHYHSEFGQWNNVRLQDRHEYWYQLSKRVPAPCQVCAMAQEAYCLQKSVHWFSKWIAERDKTTARAQHARELGPREFTFTYTPSWFADDEEAQRAMASAIEKLTRYYKDEIIEFHAIGEFTRDGRSHVHAWYHLHGGRKITDKNFKRAYPRWNPKRKLGKGFEGGHHATIERTSDFAGYAEKHLEEAWLNVNITNAEDHQEPSSPQNVSQEP